MINDVNIIISVAGSRKSARWKPQSIKWSEFVARVSDFATSTETLQQYKGMTKAQQDELKDVGGYVGGTLKENRRRNGYVEGRCLITLDADSIEPGGTQRIVDAVGALGCAFVIYSTRKHESAAPRLRLVFPTDRIMAADEYEAVARKLASFIDMNIFDPTTFQATRFMYWPSRCCDGEKVFIYEDKPFLNVDGMLELYKDWKNVEDWPQVPGMQNKIQQGLKKQAAPETKNGIIGAFCRVYDIPAAIQQFIPDVYEECVGERYTYTAGSTTGGAVLYDDGRFLYSNHATDPAGGRLNNAFDLVRIHKFGHMDAEADDNTPVAKLPSFKAMSEMVRQDDTVVLELAHEAFPNLAELEADEKWTRLLEIDSRGGPRKTAKNVQTILEHDPNLKGGFLLEQFSGQKLVLSRVPWSRYEGERNFTDTDMAGLRVYLESEYGITGKNKIDDAFDTFLERTAVNRVKAYLDSLSWDGVERIPRALADYLGAIDCYYTRAVSIKTLCAAVARVFIPGIKFDYMPTLIGSQGIGKSTFVRILGREWYTDSLKISDMKDKTAVEKLSSAWIVEASELDGMNRTEATTIKSFLSTREDVYRPAYGREVVRRKRQSIIIGTSNERAFLKDDTGNRRFWPIDCGIHTPTKSVFHDLEGEVDQIWAEAVVRFNSGESLYPDAQMNEEAVRQQEAHKLDDPREGLIAEFLQRQIPNDWYTWDMQRRLYYDARTYSGEKRNRNVICAAEIWTECFKQPLAMMKQRDTREINSLLRHLLNSHEWYEDRIYFYADYGRQRGFRRVSQMS